MALPKLTTPTYELEVPSTDEKIKYRPFLVKEEKILILIHEYLNLLIQKIQLVVFVPLWQKQMVMQDKQDLL